VKLKLWGAAAAALVLLWVALEVRALLHQWLPHGLPVWVKPLALTLPPALLVAYVTLRVVATRRLLASQVCYAAIPTESFDPSADDVATFGRALRGLRKIVLNWTGTQQPFGSSTYRPEPAPWACSGRYRGDRSRP